MAGVGQHVAGAAEISFVIHQAANEANVTAGPQLSACARGAFNRNSCLIGYLAKVERVFRRVQAIERNKNDKAVIVDGGQWDDAHSTISRASG